MFHYVFIFYEIDDIFNVNFHRLLSFSYINVQNRRAKNLICRKRERERSAKLWACRRTCSWRGGGGRLEEKRKKDPEQTAGER
jgi:hypothetical protein